MIDPKWAYNKVEVAAYYNAFQKIGRKDFIGFSELLVSCFYTLALANPALRGDAIDGGANAGHHTARLALLLNDHGHKIVAVEPNPALQTTIQKNVSAEMCTNLILVGQALYPEAGQEVTFITYDDHQQSILETLATPAMLDDKNKNAGAEKRVTVSTTTLDLLTATHSLTPKFVKLDIEGCDFKLMMCSGKFVQTHRPFIAAEVAPYSIAADEEFVNLYRFYSALGYLCVDCFGFVYDEALWLDTRVDYWNRFFVPLEHADAVIPAFRTIARQFWQANPAFRF